MRTAKTIVEVIAVAVIFGFVLGVAMPYFATLMSGTFGESHTVFLGAFLGAFFSYLFVRIGMALDAIRQRHAKHRDALIRLQYVFNEALNILGDNIFIVDSFKNIFKGYSASNEARIFGNVLHPIPYDNELLVSLGNLDLINQLYGLHVELRKLNDSMVTINRMSEKTTDAFIQGHIDHRTYVANIKNDEPRYDEIRKFLSSATDGVIEALATVRTLSKAENFISKVITWTLPAQINDAQRQRISLEETKLRAEMQQLAQESREKIKKVSGGSEK